jgi:mitofusin
MRNRVSLKTTAIFACQSNIDVVVFVVSVENHFTLSAKEFLPQEGVSLHRRESV